MTQNDHANTEPLRELAQSNSKSEDTPLKEVFRCRNCSTKILGYPCSECGVELYKEHVGGNCYYKSRSGVTMSHQNAKDIGFNCNAKVTKVGSSTPLPSENSSLAQTSTFEPPQDTSLDEKQIGDFIADKLKSFGYISGQRKCYTPKYGENAFVIEDWDAHMVGVFLAQDIQSLLSQQRAKLFEQIRSEVIGEEPMLGDKNARIEIYKLQPGQTEVHVPRVDFVTREALREEQLEALTRLEKRQ